VFGQIDFAHQAPCHVIGNRVFDTAEHCWLNFSSDDEDDGATLNAKLVWNLVQRGAKLLPKEPERS
jgi:hypothetical protein